MRPYSMPAAFFDTDKDTWSDHPRLTKRRRKCFRNHSSTQHASNKGTLQGPKHEDWTCYNSMQITWHLSFLPTVNRHISDEFWRFNVSKISKFPHFLLVHNRCNFSKCMPLHAQKTIHRVVFATQYQLWQRRLQDRASAERLQRRCGSLMGPRV